MASQTASFVSIALLARQGRDGVRRRLTLCVWQSKPNEGRTGHGGPVLDHFEPRPQGAGEKYRIGF
jgi:hypothetical protein